MKLVVLGATGMVGSRVTREAVSRGHEVLAVSRRVASPSQGVSSLSADMTSSDQLDAAICDAEAAVLAVRPPAGEEEAIVSITEKVLDAMGRSGTRLLIVGGAGALFSPDEPGLLVRDDPRYVPEAWRTVAGASVNQLEVCRGYARQHWIYLSPPAVLEPGTRTGAYRRGTTELLVDSTGISRISAEDLAVAVVDELERPSRDRHFTVVQQDGYGRCGSDRQ